LNSDGTFTVKNATVAAFDNVSKTYTSLLRRRPPVRAAEGVSFSLTSGEVFGLLGPNRAGKTTLVKLLLSLCRPTSGSVTRLGRPVSDRSTLAQVGYMHENQHFPRYWSAAGLLAYYGALTLLPQDFLATRIPELIEMVGLADRSQEPISRFSKGMVQRLGLAQALLSDPELLVLDEPTEGLDLEGRQLLRRLVKERKNKGKTVLLVSHVLTEVEQVCDRVAVMVGGKLAHVGPLDKLLRDPKTGASRPLEKVLEDVYATGKKP
jgi:ABC-2 type transport system ATP-binding protein